MLSSRPKPIRIVIERKYIDFEYKFNTDFPEELHGIITQDDFLETMQHVNNAFMHSTLGEKFNSIVVLLLLTSSLCLIFPLIPGLYLRSFIKKSQENRVKEVLAVESTKYSAKYGISLVWKLETIKIEFEGSDGSYTTTEYKLVIEMYDDHSSKKLPQLPNVFQPIASIHHIA